MFNLTKTHEITVDTVIFTIQNDKLKVLLVKRANEPFKGKWTLPGGYVKLSETLDDAALRVLKEKTNIQNLYLEQLYTFGNPLRHPSARVITVAYFALIRSDDIKLSFDKNSEVTQVEWHGVYNLPPLAFDHKEIIEYAVKRMRERLEFCPIAYQLLPHKFTLTELQKSYELILAQNLDKRNFRKKFLSADMLKELDEYTKSGSKRPARLYEFNKITINSKRGHFFS